MKRHDTDTPIVDRLKGCSHLRWIEPQESWQSNQHRFSRTGHYEYGENGHWEYVTVEPRPDLPVEWSTSYGDWHEHETDIPIGPNTFVLVEYTSGSDYSGSLVEVSNHKAIEELCQACGFEDGEDYLDYYGGYGTRALAVRVQALDGEDESGFKASLVETIEGLEDYPLVDEDLHSTMEIDAQNEAWEDWGKGEFRTELGKYFASVIRAGVEETVSEYADTFGQLACSEDLADCAENEDWVSDENVGRWFWELSEYANKYWVNEQGSDCYISMEDVVRKGIGRKLEHWEDGARKRDALVETMKAELERAYGVWFWSNVAYGMKGERTVEACARRR